MKRTFFCLCLLCLFALTGCCGPRNVVVLLPDKDGRVGAIELSNAQGSVLVDKAGEGISVASASSVPKAAVRMSDEEINRTFQAALGAEPLPPRSFLLYFKTGGVLLTDKSEKLIPLVVGEINNRQSVDISVIGHSDRYGSKEYNFILSTKRAEHVRDILVSVGVKSEMITVSSHGEGNPLVPTADNVREQKNRRVEVVVR